MSTTSLKPLLDLVTIDFNETNTLVLGNSGSGKSYQLSAIAKKMLLKNKKVYLYFNEGDLQLGNYNINHIHLIKQIYMQCGDSMYQKLDGNKIIANLPDIVIVDSLDVLSENSRKELFWLIKDRPGIKFIVASQDYTTDIQQNIRRFTKVFTGKPSLYTLSALKNDFDINFDSIRKINCSHRQFLEVL